MHFGSGCSWLTVGGMIPLRIAIVGDTKGPDLQTLMALLGKEESLRRIRTCVERNKDR